MPVDPVVGDVDLRRFLGIVRRRTLVIAVIASVVTGVALASSMRETPIYPSSSQLLFRAPLAETLFSPAAGGTSPQEIGTEIEVMRSDEVVTRVAAAFGAPVSASITPKTGASLIVVTVRDADPERAARAATVYAETYADFRRSQALDELLAVSDELDERIDAIDAQLAAPATPGSAPSSEPSGAERSRLEVCGWCRRPGLRAQ